MNRYFVLRNLSATKIYMGNGRTTILDKLIRFDGDKYYSYYEDEVGEYEEDRRDDGIWYREENMDQDPDGFIAGMGYLEIPREEAEAYAEAFKAVKFLIKE